MKTKKVQDIYQELVSTYKNLKAEVLGAEILDSGQIDIEDIDIFNKSTFSRSYRRDIIDFEIDNYSSKTDRLRVNLARNGLYDILPEGLFHQQLKEYNALAFKEIRQKHKEEEKDARAFFAPLENEFFTQNLCIEQNERKLIDNFINLNNDFILELWGLDKTIPKVYSQKLLKLLPFAHKIAGNPDLTALALENIIKEKVVINKRLLPFETPDSIKETKDSKTLGVDFVLGMKSSSVLYPVFEIEVGPIKKNNMPKFLENGEARKIISIFLSYFIPVEIDTKLEISVQKKENYFELNELDNPVLGFTTSI